MIVRDEVEDVFLEVRAGAADAVNLARADHLRQRHAELGRAHRAGQRDEHRAAAIEMRDVAVGRVAQRRGVEVAVVMIDEL